MKTNKWRKWQIGAGAALALGVLFHEIKGTEAFAKAHEEALAAKPQTNDSLSSRDMAMGDAIDNRGGFGDGARHGPRGRGDFAGQTGGGTEGATGNAGSAGNGSLGTGGTGGGSFGNGSSSQLGGSVGGTTQQPTVRSQTRTGRS